LTLQALIEAWNNGHRDEYRQLLDLIETIMLVGEPSLNPKKPDEWIDLVSECVSHQHGLPKQLASGLTVGCLQRISDIFESVLLHSTLFDVSGGNKPKRRFREKRMEHNGCIRGATIHVRLFTTSSEEKLLESGPGDIAVCPFHPKSVHFPHLLTLNPPLQGLPQIGAPDNNEFAQSNSTTSMKTQTLPTTDPFKPVVSTAGGGYGLLDAETDKFCSPINVPEPDVQTYNETEIERHWNSQLVNSIDVPNDADVRDVEDIVRNVTDQLEPTTAGMPSTEEQQNNANTRERKYYFSSSIPAKDSLFFGRSEILTQLEQILLGAQEDSSLPTSLQPVRPNLVWLSGSGGMGKSSIAIESAYRFVHRFEGVIWLRATSDANLAKCCHDSAVALGLVNGRMCQDHEVSRCRLMQYMKDISTPWLLLFDDCVEGVDISRYIPDGRLVFVIATGRQQPVAIATRDWSIINVPPFTPEEAANFFISCTKGTIRDDDAEAICSAAVCYHTSPLVCRQLVSWSTRAAISFKDINTLLNVEAMPLTLRFQPVHTVMSSTLCTLSNPASSLWVLLCFYDTTRVPKRLVLTARHREKDAGSNCDISEAATLLWKSALLDIDESQTEATYYHMHRSVQDWMRTRLDDEAWSHGFKAACSSISHHWPSKRKLKNVMGGFWEDFDNLHSHVHHLADCLTRDRLLHQVTYDPGDEFKRLLVYHNW